MVAHTRSIAERFIVPPAAVLTGQSRLLQFTRQDVATFIRLGIVPEDASTEFLNGLLVLTDRSAQGEDLWSAGRAHRITVEKLSRLARVLNNANRHVETQQPLVWGELHEPQPDFMVIRGTLEEVGEDGPTASDTFCVVEVADSSYERDAGVKLKGCARAGVQQYVIINLRNRTAEVYITPDTTAGTYSPPIAVAADQLLNLRTAEAEFFSVPLGEVLP